MSFQPSFRKWFVLLGLSASVTCLGLTHAHQPPATKDQPKSESKTETPKAKATDDITSKIREEGLNKSQVMKTVLYMTEVIGPRLTNSPGLKRANEWTAKTLTEFGLENAKLEAWGPFGTGWTLKRFSAQVTDPLCIPLIGIPKAWSPSTEGVAKGDVVHLDATDEKGLEKFVPDEFKLNVHHWLILHGRYICVARTPKCPQCGIADLCEYRPKTKT